MATIDINYSSEPGKYDDACEAASIATGGELVILIVVKGKYGHGFSVRTTPEYVAAIPRLLRIAATDIEAQHKRIKGN